MCVPDCHDRSDSRSSLTLLLILCTMLPKTHPQEFTAPVGVFNHLALDGDSGNVYIGAANRLYLLNHNLVLSQEVDTSVEGQEDNWNKVLVIDLEHQQLVTCGSLLDGHCQIRLLNNISSAVEYDSSTSVLVAADNTQDSTVAFVAPGPNGGNVLYVASTAVEGGNLRIFAPVVSSRRLGYHALSYASEDFINTIGTFLRLDASLQPWESHNKIQYKAGFSIENFSYFLAQQPVTFSEFSLDTPRLTSTIIQICHQDRTYSSYVEMPIYCDQGIDTFDLVQVAETILPASTLNNGRPIVVGIFKAASTPDKTAVCVYKIQDIRRRFTENIRACYMGNGALASQFKTGSCSADTHTIDDDFCGEPYSRNSPLAGQLSLRQEAIHILVDVDITAIALDAVGDDTVIYLGTNNGFVKKGNLPADGDVTFTEFENLSVQDGHPVQEITITSDKEHFYVLTDTKVLKLKTANCAGRESCSECSAMTNPYCGWCTLENKCSLRLECQDFEVNDHFLPYDDTSCFELRSVSPSSASIYQEERIYLEVSRLPEVSARNNYKCLFNDLESSASISSSGRLRCRAPNKNILPEIPDNTDSVEVSLSVKSTKTNRIILTTTLHFYDCKQHNWCSECTQSQWGCHWCIYDNICVDDYTSCSESALVNHQKPDECPRLDTDPPEIDHTKVIPVGYKTKVRLSGHNLPDLLQKYGSYKCVFLGLDQSFEETVVPATQSDEFITCDDFEYWYEPVSQVRHVAVKVLWHEDYYLQEQAVNVTFYKCSVMGPDCSSCLSLDRGDSQKYQCRWCAEQCSFVDSCEEQPSRSCPAPLISKVSPVNVTVDGRSPVTISGVNLGTELDDIMHVSFAGKPCIPIRELYQVSRQVVCLPEPAGHPVSGSLEVTVQGHEPSSFNGKISYKNPVLTSAVPLIGMESGGTKVTILGRSLKTGAAQRIQIGHCLCQIKSLDDTLIECITTPCDTGVKTMTVFFDGIPRVYHEQFAYTSDPTVVTVEPLRSIASGGRILTVTGTDFLAVQDPWLILHEPNYGLKAQCIVKSNRKVECPSPALPMDEPVATDVVCNISFDFDGTVVVPPNPYMMLQYVRNPRLEALNRSGLVLYHQRYETLQIQGEYFHLASSAAEIVVTIGGRACPVKTVSPTAIYCTPPKEMLRGESGPFEVKVKIGYFEKKVGKLKYLEDISSSPAGPNLALTIGTVIGSVALVSVIIVLIIVYIRARQRTALEHEKRVAEEMESNIANML